MEAGLVVEVDGNGLKRMRESLKCRPMNRRIGSSMIGGSYVQTSSSIYSQVRRMSFVKTPVAV